MRRITYLPTLAVALGLAAIDNPASAQELHETVACLVWQAEPFVEGQSVTETPCSFVSPPDRALPRASISIHVAERAPAMNNHAWVGLYEWDSNLGQQLMSTYDPEVRVTLACRASGSTGYRWQTGAWQPLSSAINDTNLQCRNPSIEIVEMAQLETRVTW